MSATDSRDEWDGKPAGTGPGGAAVGSATGPGAGAATGAAASGAPVSGVPDAPDAPDGASGGPSGGPSAAASRGARDFRDSRDSRDSHDSRDPHAAGAPRGAWDDGLIARRARPGRIPRTHFILEKAETGAPEPGSGAQQSGGSAGASGVSRGRAVTPPRPPHTPGPARTLSPGAVLRPRLDALRELVGLSGARLDHRMLAEAGRVLEEAATRQRHALDLTVVAIAGATGSGKSTLFNALARTQLSEAGVRRPTTAVPIACAWTDRADQAEGILDRLGIPPRARRQPVRPYDQGLHGLVLLDLPDHDSATTGHREQVDRMLSLVDAVIWVVDPEKYADAVLHERYLRPLSGYAEVTFVVLNQVDRLSGDAADQVLDDLRRLLDEDGLALGEHGEPGAMVMALSALTGEGVGELREALAQFTAGRNVPERRLIADVDGVAARLRPSYVATGRPGLTEVARHEFDDRLAEAVGAQAAGLAAERAWLRDAEYACGTSWSRARRSLGRGRGARGEGSTSRSTPDTPAPPTAGRTVSRPLVEQAVRALAHEAATGLPDPWAQAVRDAAGRGAEGLADALDEAAADAAAASVGTGMRPTARTGHRRKDRKGWMVRKRRAVRKGGAAEPGARVVRPRWWAVATAVQSALTALQLAGMAWLLGLATDTFGGEWWAPGVLVTGGGVGGPVVAWCCRMLSRGPARRRALETERRLRTAAAGCGRERVLEPVAAELLRYREVRAQYAIAAGGS
ncbi:ATP-binding protein [Streptomyces griseocarneus]|nr:ATP-binding protein [Streptomyces griseocarneus]